MGQATSDRGNHSCVIAQSPNTIIPSTVSVYIDDRMVSADLFIIQNNQVIGRDSLCNLLDSIYIKVQYRSFAFNIEEEVFHLDTTQMQKKDFAVYIGYDYSPFKSADNQGLIEGKGLDYNGSFTRGFSVGNNQSLVLNSNFNLQLAGDLGNDLKIVAAISDDNIPIQPEGNTQLLQEFDRVFIRLSKGQTSVIAGDYQQANTSSYFMKYFKKLKGASADHTQLLGKGKLYSRGSFAISKGKFNRFTLPIEEGNQGPYKLVGAEGERFLIVLAGSERVYYDGVLLTRGEDFDYVIDYNRAEISFTPRRIIARESRIVVEYEYADQNYTRTLYTAETSYTNEKLKINTQLYSEQDSKNGTGQANLDSTAINILQQSGDDPLAAITSGVRPVVEGDSNFGRITYRKEDNPNTPDPDDFILIYSTDTSNALFTATFSEVGNGLGDYVIDDSTGANGRVYRYLGPLMGNYLPVIQLIPPEQKQLMATQIAYQWNPNSKVYGELSVSSLDNNRLSELDDDDNQGMASLLGIMHKIDLDSSRHWQLTTDANIEYVQQSFNPLNPYRNAEFARDWSIDQEANTDESILSTTLTIAKQNTFSTMYQLSRYQRTTEYKGLRHRLQSKWTHQGWKSLLYVDYLTSDGYGQESFFLRPKLDISKALNILGGWTIGYLIENERNEVSLDGSEDVIDRSLAFTQQRVYLQSDEGTPLILRVEGKTREDELPLAGRLVSAISTKELSADATWKINGSNQISWAVGIRDFDVKEAMTTSQTSKTTILSRVSYDASGWNGAVRSSMNYDITSGQEPKQEFTYEKVEPGQGEYIFIGSPNSNESEELFLYEYRPDIDTANYVKVYLYNNEFIRTNNQAINFNLRLDPSKVMKNKKGWISKLASAHNVRLSQKIEDDGENNNFEALNFSFNNASLTAYRSLIANTLFFNRSNTAYDIQIGNKLTNTRIIQIAGFEDRSVSEFFTRVRCKIGQGIDAIINSTIGSKTYDSQFYVVRNFDIHYYNLSPELNIRPNQNLRIVTSYKYDTRAQQIRNMESAHSHDWTCELTYRQANTISYNMGFSLIDVSYNGQANTTIEYDLLDGLKNGKNYLWNLNITRRMGRNVDLNLNYDGRKTGVNPILHIARVQVKATF